MQATKQKQSIVLCSGAWHTHFHTQPIIPYFEQAGYRIVTLALRSSNQKGAIFNDDVQLIEDAINLELEAGCHVYLALHSMAGPCGTEAVNRVLLRDASIALNMHIIYVCSFIYSGPEIGNYMFSQGFIEADATEGVIKVVQAYDAFYNDMSRTAAQPCIEALSPLNIHDPPELSSEQWMKVPRNYILCTEDATVIPETARKEASLYDIPIVTMEAAHCPFISKPREFFDVVEGIIQS